MRPDRRLLLALAAFLASLAPAPASAAPGDLLDTVKLPETAAGVSIAVDSDGNLYYTNVSDPYLYRTDLAGTAYPRVRVTALGSPVIIDEIVWDQGRGVLWGARSTSDPTPIYWIDPASGIATLAFKTISTGLNLTDGLAYDASDDSVWVSTNGFAEIDHYAADGTYLGQLIPKGANGMPLETVSGIVAGKGDRLYLSMGGYQTIVRVQKTNGQFLGSFPVPAGTWAAGLECDGVHFTVPTIWSRDNYASEVYAIEAEPGTLDCGNGSSCLPGPVPGPIGNSLAAVKQGSSNVALSWDPELDARTYVLRRGTDKGVWPSAPLRSGLIATSDTEPDLLGPDSRYFYRVAGADCLGQEGP